MKKPLCTVLLLIAMAVCLCGCAEEVSRVPVDCRYTEAWSGVETKTEYEYDIWNSRHVLVPKIETVHHPEQYELLWQITYSDSSTSQIWKTCTQAEYETFRKGVEK